MDVSNGIARDRSGVMVDEALIRQFQDSRFLFVIGQYDAMGGSERQAIILAKELQRYGCCIHFLSWGGAGRVTDQLAEMNIPAHTFPLSWQANRTKRLFELRRLTAFIRKIAPDYLLPYIGFNCKIIGLIWKRTGAKYTWWNQRDEGRDLFGSKIERRIIHSVPNVISNSFEGRDFLVNRYDLPADRIKVIQNGIRIPTLAENAGQCWRRELGLEERDLLLTMVANLTKYKDHETLLKAFAKLCDQQPETRFHLALAGMYRETTLPLKSLAFDLNLSGKVHFLGPIESVPELLAATDLYVHSSYTEGCPNAVLEAMSQGVCVCGTDVSGIRQALGDSVDGIVAPPQDSEALRNVMRRLANNTLQRERLGAMNRQRIADHFSPELLTNNVLALIAASLSKGNL
jgi:glycosyltransferase involved in cell wall biosynthesis